MTYTEIYQRYSKGVYNSIYRIVEHSGEAEDLLQETFLDAFEDLDTFMSHSNPAAWLKRVGINKAIGLLRKRKKLFIEWQDDFTDQQTDSIDEEGFVMNLNLVLDAITQLPIGYKTIVQLYLIEDLPQNDIAEILKISPGTVRSQYFRAKKQIIKHVEKMKKS